MIIAVANCDKCPFLATLAQKTDETLGQPICKVSSPPNRPLYPESLATEKPVWCPLKREQVIVRAFNN